VGSSTQMIGYVVFLLYISAAYGTLLTFNFSGPSNYEFGLAMGKQFSKEIQARMTISRQMQQSLLPFYNSDNGQAVYQTFVNSHTKRFPDYVKEMQGIADGSGVPFHVLFLMSLREEFSFWINSTSSAKQIPYFRDHCSDYMLNNQDWLVVGHNEDGAIEDVGHMVLVTATVGEGKKQASFTTVVYLGELPTGAFGFNSYGIALSLNYVSPAASYAVLGGWGRNFVTRDLLQAQTIEDAISRFTQNGQCAGHNAQLMDMVNHRLFNVEAASYGLHNVLEISHSVSPYFHANMYLRLYPINETQPVDQSTVGRTDRVHELPLPTNPVDILNVLGDQENRPYPLFHDMLSHLRGDISLGWTLASALFDVRNATVTIYYGNPKLQQVQFHLFVTSM